MADEMETGNRPQYEKGKGTSTDKEPTNMEALHS